MSHEYIPLSLRKKLFNKEIKKHNLANILTHWFNVLSWLLLLPTGLGILASPRLGLVPEKTTAEQAHELLEAMVTPEQVYPFHIQLIKHGRRTCTAQRPKCPACPLRLSCPSAAVFDKGLGRRKATTL